jgi:hypothetical protein
MRRVLLAAVSAALVVALEPVVVECWAAIGAADQLPPQSSLQLAPLGAAGEAVFPAFEGWGPSKDGQQSVLLLGYFNRNKDQELDIPIGPNNRIEPGGPDYGQPTHFHTGRQWGVFAITVPKDFGTKKLTWTLVANGQTSVVSFWLNPPYWIDYFKHGASGNEPPVIKFSEIGPEMTGPPVTQAAALAGTVGQPVPLKLWVRDAPPTYDPTEGLTPRPAPAAAAPADAPARRAETAGRGAATNFDLSAASGPGGQRARPTGTPADITVTWKKYRGPGEVKLADEAIKLTNKKDGKLVLEAATTATFSAPGEYWLRVQVNDASGEGGGGDQCCWTTAHVKVIVK